MKSLTFILIIMTLLSFTNRSKMNSTTNTGEKSSTPCELYQLKTYTFDTEAQVQTTDNYLKEAYLPAMKRQNINKIGVFKPIPNEKDSIRKIYVLIPFSSADQFLAIETNLENDKAYLAAGAEYRNAAHNLPPYRRLESTLMKAFEGMPAMKMPEFTSLRSDRVYELRSYEAATENYLKLKVEMFNSGELQLFEKLEFNAVFYGEIISGAKMPNLMYMTTFPTKESRDKHWDTFGKSAEWNQMKNIPKYENTVSHADILFLYPTEYSDY